MKNKQEYTFKKKNIVEYEENKLLHPVAAHGRRTDGLQQ